MFQLPNSVALQQNNLHERLHACSQTKPWQLARAHGRVRGTPVGSLRLKAIPANNLALGVNRIIYPIINLYWRWFATIWLITVLQNSSFSKNTCLSRTSIKQSGSFCSTVGSTPITHSGLDDAYRLVGGFNPPEKY